MPRYTLAPSTEDLDVGLSSRTESVASMNMSPTVLWACDPISYRQYKKKKAKAAKEKIGADRATRFHAATNYCEPTSASCH